MAAESALQEEAAKMKQMLISLVEHPEKPKEKISTLAQLWKLITMHEFNGTILNPNTYKKIHANQMKRVNTCNA